MFYGKEKRFLRFTGEIAEKSVLTRLSGEESLSACYKYDLDFISEQKPENMLRFLGKEICCEIRDGEMHRYIHGILTSLQEHRHTSSQCEYTAVISPALCVLDLNAHTTVWQGMNVPDIVRKILANHNIYHIEMRLTGVYPVLEWCMQYQESDLNFIGRLLASEGIYFYFQHEQTHHVMILADHPSAHRNALRSAWPYLPLAGLHNPYGIESWTVDTDMIASSVKVTGYDMKQAVTVTGCTTSDKSDVTVGTVDVMIGSSEHQKDRLEKLSRIQMEALEAQSRQHQVQSKSWWVQNGEKFTLTGHPLYNGEYIISGLRVEARNNIGDQVSESECALTVFPASQLWRTTMMLPRPIIHGVLTAVVVGPDSEEVHTDEYGRIQICFLWDNKNQPQQHHSAWVRVSQPWAGNRYGVFFLPRVGSEVIVSFINGDPDCPVITGAVSNGKNLLPLNLPEEKYHSGLFARSGPAGQSGEGHILRFDDTRGEELLSLRSQRNLLLAANEDMMLLIKNKLTVNCSGEGNISLDKGNLTVDLAEGDFLQNITGGDLIMTVSAGKSQLKSNDTVMIESSRSIILQVGSSSLEITPDGITLQANNISLKGTATTIIKTAAASIEGSGMVTIDGAVINIG